MSEMESQNEVNKEMLSALTELSATVKELSNQVNTSKKLYNDANNNYSLDADSDDIDNSYQGELLAEEKLRDISVRIYEKPISFSGSNIPLAQDIYYAQRLGLKLRYIQADLNGGQLVFDGDKFRSSTGQLKFSRINLGFTDMLKGFIRRNNEESFFLPSINGVGNLQLKDTIKYLTMVKCVDNRKFILEQGVYASSAGQFKFGVHADTKLGSIAFSGKNMLQTTVEGKGILILELPVPPSELVMLRVTPDRPVRVNEQEVIYREGNVKRNKKLSSGLFGSMASGTGFVEEYTGDGYVVLAPSMSLMDIITKDLDISKKDREIIENDTTSGSFLQRIGNLRTQKNNKYEDE